MTIFSNGWYGEIKEEENVMAEVLNALDEKTKANFFKAFEDIGITDLCESKSAKAKQRYWAKKLNVPEDYIFSFLY